MLETQPHKKLIRPKFISLQFKLLVGFTLVFSGVFAIAYSFFYKFVSETALHRIETDLINTLQVAATGVDGDLLLSLSQVGEATPEGQTNVTDPRYWEHVQWLATVERVEPRAYIYTYVSGTQPNSVTFIGSGSAVNRNREKADGTIQEFNGAKFLAIYVPKRPFMIQGFSALTTIDKPYQDDWGSWITGYMPVQNSSGESITAIGVDFQADYVIQVQNKIRQQVIVAFVITYSILLILVDRLSRIFTKPLIRLTKVAENLGEGNYAQDLSFLQTHQMEDEMSSLARVFQIMMDKVRIREETLQQQVNELRIEIDQAKRKQQVKEITETNFFHDLQVKARAFRNRTRPLTPNQSDELSSLPPSSSEQ